MGLQNHQNLDSIENRFRPCSLTPTPPILRRGVGAPTSPRGSVGVDRIIMKSYVYILRDQRGKFYVGSTSDIERRIKQHFSGHTQTTRNMKELKLIFSQEYESLEIARRIERKIKKLKRKDYIEKMIKDGYIKMK